MNHPTERIEGGRALILVGHGSQYSGDSSAPVYAHAARIRELGHFDEVVEAFWKEEPYLADALDLVSSREVQIVPFFLAEGYFTREVVPREMRLEGSTTMRGEQVIRYCRPVGAHPRMGEMILARARALCIDADRRRQAALVVIGHGTDRSPTSGGTVRHLLDDLRARHEFGTVECGFLDEEPRIERVLNALPAREVVLVPFFVAEGWHTRSTIPEELALDGLRTERGEQTIWYTAPVGTLDGITGMILELAGAAEGPLAGRAPIGAEAAPTGVGAGVEPSGSSAPRAGAPTLLSRARAAFGAWLAEGGAAGRVLLDLLIRPGAAGEYEIRHRLDAGAPSQTLRIEAPGSARDLARTDAHGAYRPLRSLASLQRGWRMEDLTAAQLGPVLDAIYPAAIVHWSRAQGEGFLPTSYAEWAGRQSGIHAGLSRLAPERVENVVARWCEAKQCRRTRIWVIGPAPARTSGAPRPRFGVPADALEAFVPCLEPCPLFASSARSELPDQRED